MKAPINDKARLDYIPSDSKRTRRGRWGSGRALLSCEPSPEDMTSPKGKNKAKNMMHCSDPTCD